ncbi:hypothetical protein V2J09_020616 [Rumex salicifolius]
MCYHHEETWSNDALQQSENVALADLRLRLADSSRPTSPAVTRRSWIFSLASSPPPAVNLTEMVKTLIGSKASTSPPISQSPEDGNNESFERWSERDTVN